MNFLVETKTEYTYQLVNIITPYLYEGFKSIYEEAKKISKKGEELKVFQTCLRRIPSWTQETLKAETKRIMTESNCADILDDLLKAVIKSNIMILTNTPPDGKNKLKINFLIELDKFIHNSYIESAKNIFQNPYLFFDKCTPLELKRNERESHETIKNSINDAIRKMLPINMILKEYLGRSYIDSIQNENIDKIVSEQDKTRLTHLLKSNENEEVKYQLTKNVQTNPQLFNNIKIGGNLGDKTEKKNSDSDSDHNSVSNSASILINKKRAISPSKVMNPIEKERYEMPTQFRKSIGGSKDDHISASESYIPQNNKNLAIFESYNRPNNKQSNNHSNTNNIVVRDTVIKGGSKRSSKHQTETQSEQNTKIFSKGGMYASEKEKEKESESITISESYKKKENTTQKKKYIDREFNI